MTKHITVRVESGANKNSVDRIGDDILKVTTTKPARDGVANKAVVRLVRDFVSANGSVRIVSGHKQGNKIAAISD
jgi:uncharacterized protein YggU (UPF0235/DUF167 family)